MRLQVIDNGPGFADKVLKRAFEPYVTTKAKGTGLGLAVVKKIADEHGARVRIANLSTPTEADPGGVLASGRASFVIIFQIRPGGGPKGCCGHRREPGALRPHGHHSCSRRRTGHTCPALGDPHRRGPHGGAGGKRRRRPAPPASALRPDLVLLDIWMPDVDGITLLKEWGATGLLTMPVIMMSGHGTIDTAVEATKFGAMAFLEKPITLQKLLRAVEQGLAKPAARTLPGAGGNHGSIHALHAEPGLTVEAAMTGGAMPQQPPLMLGPAGRAELRPRPARCAKRATPSRRATSSSTWPRKTAA